MEFGCMRMKNSKKAYTLAEIMIVILILTVIFAAFAPFFTKRIAGNHDKTGIWSWLNDSDHNAKKTEATGQVYFGVTPSSQDENTTVFAPASKVVIRSGGFNDNSVVQRQIQFRYGRTNTNDGGDFAGSWLADGKNILLGGTYNKIMSEAKNNVSIGINSLSNIKDGTGNVAVGYSSFFALETGKNNVAVGYKAGSGRNNVSNLVLVGYEAGAGPSVSNQIAIGYQSASATQALSTDKVNNIYIGAFSGQNSGSSAKQNIGIGYNALNKITSGYNNVAIGAHALENVTTGYNNTAIGYGACAEVGEASNKTCIGYNSGPHLSTFPNKDLYKNDKIGPFVDDRYSTNKGIFATDWVHNNTDKQYANDSQMRTYIGSKPYNYGGDAVLEIHNLNTINGGYNELETSPFNVTTVVNGNLVVRGRTYFTVGSKLYHFYDSISDNKLRRAQNVLDPIVSFYGFIDSDLAKMKCSDSYSSYDFSVGCINLKTKVSSSDRRLKNITSKNIAGLNQLRKLKVYNFTFKNDKNKTPQVGVLAQELMKIFPTAVFQDENGYYKIRWDEMFFAVINSIKEIDKRITAVIKKTVSIENQITKLESENVVLKNQVNTLTQRINKLKAQ